VADKQPWIKDCIGSVCNSERQNDEQRQPLLPHQILKEAIDRKEKETAK
jgi:hypothetical protein